MKTAKKMCKKCKYKKMIDNSRETTSDWKKKNKERIAKRRKEYREETGK